MKSGETLQEILCELQEAVVSFDPYLVRQAAERVVSEGVDAYDAIVNGLAAGIERAWELYACGEYFLPELTMCADTFYEGVAILRPHVKQDSGRRAKGTVIIGTIEGDKHDIGKNLVKLMLEVAGLTVYDLGVNVRPEEFVQASIRRQADLVCLSATLTTASLGLRQVIDRLRLGNPQVKIMVGGGAVSEQDACKWGVDGYAPDAWSIWRTATHLTGLPVVHRELAPVS